MATMVQGKTIASFESFEESQVLKDYEDYDRHNAEVESGPKVHVHRIEKCSRGISQPRRTKTLTNRRKSAPLEDAVEKGRGAVNVFDNSRSIRRRSSSHLDFIAIQSSLCRRNQSRSEAKIQNHGKEIIMSCRQARNSDEKTVNRSKSCRGIEKQGEANEKDYDKAISSSCRQTKYNGEIEFKHELEKKRETCRRSRTAFLRSQSLREFHTKQLTKEKNRSASEHISCQQDKIISSFGKSSNRRVSWNMEGSRLERHIGDQRRNKKSHKKNPIECSAEKVSWKRNMNHLLAAKIESDKEKEIQMKREKASNGDDDTTDANTDYAINSDTRKSSRRDILASLPHAFCRKSRNLFIEDCYVAPEKDGGKNGVASKVSTCVRQCSNKSLTTVQTCSTRESTDTSLVALKTCNRGRRRKLNAHQNFKKNMELRCAISPLEGNIFKEFFQETLDMANKKKDDDVENSAHDETENKLEDLARRSRGTDQRFSMPGASRNSLTNCNARAA